MQNKPSLFENALWLLYALFALGFLAAVVLSRVFGVFVAPAFKRGTFALALIFLGLSIAVLLPENGVRLHKSVFVVTQVISFAWWLAVLAEYAR